MFGDYISREAAIISLTGMFLDKSKDYCAACKAIERLHAADVVKVVRCKDCKHFTYCENDCCMPGNFCSQGERAKK